MIELRRILCPTDFSDRAAYAQNYACTLAAKFGAELHLLNVVQPVELLSTDPTVPLIAPTISPQELMSAAEAQLAALKDLPVEGELTVVRTVRDGLPFLAIVEYAKEFDIDLIVISTHGRTGLAHMFLGSTAEKIMREAPCPVLTVRPKPQS